LVSFFNYYIPESIIQLENDYALVDCSVYLIF
jgi:hypothetical protein